MEENQTNLEEQTESPVQTKPVKTNFFRRDLGLSSMTGGFAYSFDAILYMSMSVIFMLIYKFAVPYMPSVAAQYISLLISPVAIAVTVTVITKTRKVKFSQICPVKTKPKYYVISVLMIFGLMVVGILLNVILQFILQSVGFNSSAESSAIALDVSGVKVLPAILCIAIIPAFVEELLFRGVILTNCEQSMGSVRAIFVSAFSFALMHGSPMQTIHQFLLGCALAFLAVRARSIIPGMIAHFLNNFCVVMLMYFISGVDLDSLMASETMPIAIIIAFAGIIIFCLLAVGAAVGMLLWLIFDKNKNMIKGKKGGVRSFFLAATAGISIMSIVWILSLLGIM